VGVFKGRFLTVLAVLAGAACSFGQNGLFKENFELAFKTQQFTEAVVSKDTRTIYWLFTPAFRAEHSFARFDSAMDAWYAGRRVVRASRRVSGIDGPSATASAGVWFENEDDYNFLFESWVNTGRNWELVWVSKILDQSFQFGRSDTAELRKVAAAALRYLVSKKGRASLKMGVPRPDTLVVVRRDRIEEGPLPDIDGIPVVWLTPAEVMDSTKMPDVPFYCGFALVRITGDVALATVDFYQGGSEPRSGVKGRRGLELYFQRRKGVWQFNAAGKALK
jgi:hypothetical protein